MQFWASTLPLKRHTEFHQKNLFRLGHKVSDFTVRPNISPRGVAPNLMFTLEVCDRQSSTWDRQAQASTQSNKGSCWRTGTRSQAQSTDVLTVRLGYRRLSYCATLPIQFKDFRWGTPSWPQREVQPSTHAASNHVLNWANLEENLASGRPLFIWSSSLSRRNPCLDLKFYD